MNNIKPKITVNGEEYYVNFHLSGGDKAKEALQSLMEDSQTTENIQSLAQTIFSQIAMDYAGKSLTQFTVKYFAPKINDHPSYFLNDGASEKCISNESMQKNIQSIATIFASRHGRYIPFRIEPNSLQSDLDEEEKKRVE